MTMVAAMYSGYQVSWLATRLGALHRLSLKGVTLGAGEMAQCVKHLQVGGPEFGSLEPTQSQTQ